MKYGIVSPNGNYFTKNFLAEAFGAKIYSLDTDFNGVDCEHVFLIGFESLQWYSCITNPKFKSAAAIFCDRLFMINYNWCNEYCYNHGVQMYGMPDLEEYFIHPYIPAYQITKIPFEIEIKKPFDKLIIGHSPQREKMKKNLKGTVQIDRAVGKLISDYEIELKIITKMTWENCLLEVSKCNIFVDQIIKDNKYVSQEHWTSRMRYGGGLGQSGLEAMALKCCTITSGDIPKTEKYFPPPPVIFTQYRDLVDDLESVIKDSGLRNDLMLKQHDWVGKYCCPEFVTKNLTRHIQE